MIGRPPALGQSKIDDVRAMYLSGSGFDKIAQKYSVSRTAVRYFLVKNDIEIRTADFAKASLNDHFFDCVDSTAKAYYLGLLLTDGNVYGTRVCVNLKDCDLLVKFAKALDAPGLSISQTIKKVGATEHKGFRLQFRSKTMVTALAKLGIVPNKTWTTSAWDGPEDLIPHFWRGCVDGDGWVTEPKPGRFAVGLCGTESLVNSFSDFVKNTTGFQPNKARRSNGIFVCQVDGIEVVRSLCSKLYGDAGDDFLDRKMETAQMAILAKKSLRQHVPSPSPSLSGTAGKSA